MPNPRADEAKDHPYPRSQTKAEAAQFTLCDAPHSEEPSEV